MILAGQVALCAVTAVYKYFETEEEPEDFKCNALGEKGVLFRRLDDLEEDTGEKTKPGEFKLDFRRLKAPQRAALKHKLEGNDGNLETVVSGTMIEHSTVAAMLLEMELRLEPKDTRLIKPSEVVF